MKRLTFTMITALAMLAAATVHAQPALTDPMFGEGWPFWPFQQQQPHRQQAQNPQQVAVQWDWNIDFAYHLDNREFAASHDAYVPSSTINSAFFTPTTGIRIQQSRYTSHSVMVGIDMVKNMGQNPIDPSHVIYAPGEADPALSNAGLFREITLSYAVETAVRNGIFKAYAGVFPRTRIAGDYTEAIFSDSLKVMDRNIEGLLLNWRTRRFSAELGCDWMGRYGVDRREKFQIFSAGRYDFTSWLSAGWSADMIHFACSSSAAGVMYNNLLNPYVKLDLADFTRLQELSLKAGALASYQAHQTYGVIDATTVLAGGEFVLRAAKWNVAIENTLYVGRDQMPYFNDCYSGTSKVEDAEPVLYRYAEDLYFGSPLYRSPVYNRLEISWEPKITSFLSVRTALRLHMGRVEGAMMGNQQVFSLIFDLEELRHPGLRFKEDKKHGRKTAQPSTTTPL